LINTIGGFCNNPEMKVFSETCKAPQAAGQSAAGG